MGVLSHALFLKGVDLDTFFEGSRQMVKIYNFLCTEAKTIREKVFMEEQGFKNEFDEYDEMVPHAVLFMEGRAVATGRLLPGERSGDFIIGRVAVLPEFRGRNLGAQIMLVLEQEARKDPYSVAVIYSYLYHKEHEVNRLTIALECVRYGVDPEQSLRYIRNG